MPTTVAIIMRAKDEMPHVRHSLERLQRQTFQAFDLFAVDSGSTDGTLEALETCCKGARLTRIAPEAYVPGKVLNGAIARTTHDVIVLLNADAVPCSESWLHTLIAPILENRADITFSRQLPRTDARFIVAYDYQRAYDQERIRPDFFSAVACAFRREQWNACRFREQGYAEDAIWARACREGGARIELVTASEVEHSHNYTLRQLYRKQRRQAVAMAQCGIYRPMLAAQAYVCVREMVRDLLYAISRFRLTTIPYNLAYRMVGHAAMYSGLREGRS